MAKYATQVGFHYADDAIAKSKWGWDFKNPKDTEFTYTFENFFHPFVGELIAELNKKSLSGLLDPTFHQSLTNEFFANY